MLCGRKRKVFHAASRGKAYIYLLLTLSRLFLYSGQPPILCHQDRRELFAEATVGDPSVKSAS